MQTFAKIGPDVLLTPKNCAVLLLRSGLRRAEPARRHHALRTLRLRARAPLDARLAPLSRHVHKRGRIVAVRGAPALFLKGENHVKGGTGYARIDHRPHIDR
jgi:hypothetical protein